MPLQIKNKRLLVEISRLRKKGQSFKARAKNAEKLVDSVAFNRIASKLSTFGKLFLRMQLENAKHPKGRRFSLKEKVLSLSIYKKSPKCYNLLYKYFALPSAKAMKCLTAQIKLSPGINTIIFDKIKNTIREKSPADRICSLIFDEMSLSPQITYNAQKDAFEGFATSRENEIADHALVFMIKGVKQNFKQPIAYYFTNGLNKYELKHYIKCVIKHAQDAGLIILNTVCDQSAVNVAAITDLINETKCLYFKNGKEWRHDLFRVNGRSVIPIYDAPHLIKGIRNNILSKDLVYTTNHVEKIVKWEYFQQIYATDQTYGELRLLNKITEEHINPERINKMRVKTATQLLSHSVAVAGEHFSARGDLPIECRQIIDVTELFDKLFDSLMLTPYIYLMEKFLKGQLKSFLLTTICGNRQNKF
jgi:DNA transposase THAP9